MALTTYTAGEVLTAASLNANFTFAAANPPASTAGLVCVKAETAFSAETTITEDNVFSSTYSNYLLLYRYTSSLSTGNTLIRLRVGGVSASGANYNNQYVAGVSTSALAARVTNGTSTRIAVATTGDYKSSSINTLFSPAVAEPTTIHSQVLANQAGYTVPTIFNFAANHTVATAYDGFELFATAGTITGTYAIYGYSKTV